MSSNAYFCLGAGAVTDLKLVGPQGETSLRASDPE